MPTKSLSKRAKALRCRILREYQMGGSGFACAGGRLVLSNLRNRLRLRVEGRRLPGAQSASRDLLYLPAAEYYSRAPYLLDLTDLLYLPAAEY